MLFTKGCDTHSIIKRLKQTKKKLHQITGSQMPLQQQKMPFCTVYPSGKTNFPAKAGDQFTITSNHIEIEHEQLKGEQESEAVHCNCSN